MSVYNKPIYRTIAVRMWGDRKFRELLTPMQPSGQGLWINLLTGRHTGIIPGLFSAGKAAMAESLGWSPGDFERCFSEIEQAGMAFADWRSQLVWIPKAVEYNRPDNPNVVKSWGRAFNMLPECALREEACDALRYTIGKLGGKFAAAFRDAFDGGKSASGRTKSTSYANPSGNPLPNPPWNGSRNGSGDGSVNGLGTGCDNPSEKGSANSPDNGPSNGHSVHPETRRNAEADTPPESAFPQAGQNPSEFGAAPAELLDKSTPYANPSADPLANGSDNGQRNGMANQEQEQKQEQEQRKTESPSGDLSKPGVSTWGSSDDESALRGHVAVKPSKVPPPPCPHVEIVDLYHAVLPALSRVIKSRWHDSESAAQLATRWREGWEAGQKGVAVEEFGFTTREQGLEAFRWFFERASSMPHLRGENDRGWKADLRWLVRQSNFNKVLEGRYAMDARGRESTAAGVRGGGPAVKPSRLGVQPGDTYNHFDHLVDKSAPLVNEQDKRVLLFEDGLYVFAEDFVLLRSRNGELFESTLAEYEPYGQVVTVVLDRLPKRVRKMRDMRMNGWIDAPPIPIDPAELPEFPPMRVSPAKAA